ncbi:hypothetical protein WH47_02869 [Habropoda laboriosa]|uniref:Uncharacterized protein n=1 Tax=Habropoda laboriosa TaxID=597456 RepID=A0A0L7RI13_9HYME|nr:hypothetical protein WH47_02869 [Habropoda laboriosa]
MAPRVRKDVKRTAMEKSPPTKEPPGKGRSRTAPSKRRISKLKTKGRRGKEKLKLKGWLATPADWARFNAWAKINAQPKKYLEPEPIVSSTNILTCMYVQALYTRYFQDRPAKPLYELKRRMKVLAVPRSAPDLTVNCRLDHTISKTALKAVASRRTLLLALPNIRLFDFGRVYYKVSPAALKYEPSHRIIALSQPRVHLPDECKPPRLSMCERRGLDEERLRKLALAKKLVDCPQELTKEEIEELFTPQGIRRSALTYEVTPWIEFLSLPPYKNLKGRKDENAIIWRKQIIEEGEKRGKSALVEYREKEKERRKAKKRKCEETRKKKGRESGDSEKLAELTEEDAKKAKKRKIEKHSWRFAPFPHKDDPFRIKEAALNAQESPRTAELAKSRVHKSKAIRSDAFTVKKAALSASPSARVEALAKPSRTRSPVEKRPPREKDAYGRPIFEMPVYGKVLPKMKPYKMGECPTQEKKTIVKKRPIDPIAYEPTIDPCIHPDLAKRQKLERKRTEKLLGKRKGRGKRRKKEEKSKTSKSDENAEQEKDEETDVTIDENEDEKE